jgi:branched-subunit amino acid aminotransferase/4-amino-4-deoxychorismate lyase
MYGESVFTTMKMISGSVLDWSYHFDRLRQGVEFVYGPFTEGDNWEAILRSRIEQIMTQVSGDKVIRLVVYLDGKRGILKHSLISVTDLLINISSSAFDPGQTHSRGLKLRVVQAPVRPAWWPSFLKAGNYFETILTQKMFLKSDDDDLLFISSSGEVLESSVANIFILRNNTLYTAPAGPNVLQGVMRRKVIERGVEVFAHVIEAAATIPQLMEADAVLGSNSVRGLFLIQKVDDKEFIYDQNFLEQFETLRSKVSQ